MTAGERLEPGDRIARGERYYREGGALATDGWFTSDRDYEVTGHPQEATYFRDGGAGPSPSRGYQVLSTPGLGVGVVCLAPHHGEDADLTSGSFRSELPLDEIFAMAARHARRFHP